MEEAVVLVGMDDEQVDQEEHVMDIRHFSIFVFLIYEVENSTRYLPKFLLEIYLYFPQCYLLSNYSISRTILLT